MGIGVISSVAGYLTSIYADLAPGAMIVLVTIAFFVISLPIASMLHKGKHRALDDDDPLPAPHETSLPHEGHIHGPGCGHEAIVHGDHIDYIHDGHLHCPHGDHYDEH